MTSTDTTADADALRRDTSFIGHPIGLAWLAGTEVWERFSYYGMQSLLVLYMVHTLLTHGHIEHVLGMASFRAVFESAYGPLTAQALASNTFGWYAGLVYVTPILGGLLADRVTGRTWAVTIGAGLMALGHFLMAFDQSFLLALLCLLLGVGCFKGNIVSQVGDLYAHDDPRRADAFQIYFVGIQIAVIFSPFICGTLAAMYGWHWGFGCAGVGMLIGLGVYLLGRPHFPPEPTEAQKAAARETHPLTPQDWGNVALLVALLPVLALGLVANNQIFNAYLVWGEKAYNLSLFGWHMPITDILSFGSIISTLTMIMSISFWRWWAARWPEPDELAKITLGTSLATIGPLLLALLSTVVATSGHPVSLVWAIVFEFVNDLGFANILPVSLALYSRAAPKGLNSVMIGIYYLHLFAGNVLVGWLGGLFDKMPATSFWLMHAGVMATSVVLLLLFRFAAGRRLAPAYGALPHGAAEAAA
jgi:POT family proton-dependent oligopeptide transporter